MRDCIECGQPTEGSIGAAGIRWTALCQSCKDAADQHLEKSIGAFAAAADFMMPRITKALMFDQPFVSEQPSPTTPEAA